MKHPSDEEWLLYAEGETSPDVARRLSEHARTCSDCAEQLAARKRAITRLEQLKWPEISSKTRLAIPPMIKWGIAATLAIGIGIVFGRMTGVEASLSQDLRTEIRNSVRNVVAAELRNASASSDTASSNILAALEGRIVQASRRETVRFWQTVSASLTQARAEERQALVKMLQDLKQRHEEEYEALHRELETLASMTDGEIREARLRIMRLAAMPQNKTKE